MWKVLLWVLSKTGQNKKAYVAHKEDYLMLKVFWLLFLLIGQTDKTQAQAVQGRQEEHGVNLLATIHQSANKGHDARQVWP